MYDSTPHFVPFEYKFTGKERDAESGLDYFGARYYASAMGRFSSPDPSGLYYANPANPQSLNLYSYVLNNPLLNTDPSGMECVWDDGSFDSADDKDTGSGEKCGAQGGTWIDPDQFEHGLLTNGQNANYQRGDWSGSANSVLQASWATPAATVSATPDNSVTLDVPMAVWNWSALQTTKPSGVWTYGNWAGPGGSGAPIDNLDAGAMMHDYCYHQGGFGAMSNYGGHSDALQACNQALCDTAAKAEAAALAPIESAAARNQGPNDPGGHLMNEANAAADVMKYFSIDPVRQQLQGASMNGRGLRLAKTSLILAGILLLLESLLGGVYVLGIGFSTWHEVITDLCLTLAFPIYLVSLAFLRGAAISCLWVFFVIEWIDVCSNRNPPGFVNPFAWVHGDFLFAAAILVSYAAWVASGAFDQRSGPRMSTLLGASRQD